MPDPLNIPDPDWLRRLSEQTFDAETEDASFGFDEEAPPSRGLTAVVVVVTGPAQQAVGGTTTTSSSTTETSTTTSSTTSSTSSTTSTTPTSSTTSTTTTTAAAGWVYPGRIIARNPANTSPDGGAWYYKEETCWVESVDNAASLTEGKRYIGVITGSYGSVSLVTVMSVIGATSDDGGFWAVLLAGPGDADANPDDFSAGTGTVTPCDPDTHLPSGGDCDRGYAWAKVACKPCSNQPAVILKTPPSDAHPDGQYVGGTQCWNQLYEIQGNRRVPLIDPKTGRQTVVWVTKGPVSLNPICLGAGLVFKYVNAPDSGFVRVTGFSDYSSAGYDFYPGLLQGFSVTDGFYDLGSLDDPDADESGGPVQVQLFQKSNAPLSTDGNGIYFAQQMPPDFDFGDGPTPIYCTPERPCSPTSGGAGPDFSGPSMSGLIPVYG